MAILDFPSAPTVGQQYSASNGGIYKWDGAAWALGGPASGQPAGGDLSGTYPNPNVARVVGIAQTLPVASRIVRSTPQSIPNATWTPVTFDVHDTRGYAVNGIWNAGTPDRLVIGTSGFYSLSGFIQWAASMPATNASLCALYINGGQICGMMAHPWVAADPNPLALNIAIGFICNATEYVQLYVYQSSGSAWNVVVATLMAARIG